MIVCLCHRVSERDIARAAAEGCDSFEALQFELRVGTGCGRCGDCALEAFERHAGARPATGCACDGGCACSTRLAEAA